MIHLPIRFIVPIYSLRLLYVSTLTMENKHKQPFSCSKNEFANNETSIECARDHVWRTYEYSLVYLIILVESESGIK